MRAIDPQHCIRNLELWINRLGGDGQLAITWAQKWFTAPWHAWEMQLVAALAFNRATALEYEVRQIQVDLEQSGKHRQDLYELLDPGSPRFADLWPTLKALATLSQYVYQSRVKRIQVYRGLIGREAALLLDQVTEARQSRMIPLNLFTLSSWTENLLSATQFAWPNGVIVALGAPVNSVTLSWRLGITPADKSDEMEVVIATKRPTLIGTDKIWSIPQALHYAKQLERRETEVPSAKGVLELLAQFETKDKDTATPTQVEESLRQLAARVKTARRPKLPWD